MKSIISRDHCEIDKAYILYNHQENLHFLLSMQVKDHSSYSWSNSMLAIRTIREIRGQVKRQERMSIFFIYKLHALIHERFNFEMNRWAIFDSTETKSLSCWVLSWQFEIILKMFRAVSVIWRFVLESFKYIV